MPVSNLEVIAGPSTAQGPVYHELQPMLLTAESASMPSVPRRPIEPVNLFAVQGPVYHDPSPVLPGEVDTAPIIPVPVDQPVDSNIVPPGNPDSPIGDLPPADRARRCPASRRGRGRPRSASGQRAAVRQREPHVPRQVPAAARRPRRGRRTVDNFERAYVPVRGVRRQRELSPTEILSYKRHRGPQRGVGDPIIFYHF